MTTQTAYRHPSISPISLGSTNTPSRSSLRRSACDRCRYMKLKCVRDRTFPWACVRCVRSAEQCLTGPPKPLGRAARSVAAAATVATANEGTAAISQEQLYSALCPGGSALILSDSFSFGATVPSDRAPLNIFDDTLPLEDNTTSGGPDADALLSLLTSTDYAFDLPSEELIMPGVDEDSIGEDAISLSGSGQVISTGYTSPDMADHLSYLNLTLSQQLSFFTTSSWHDTLAETTTPEPEASRSTPICRVLGLLSDLVGSICHRQPQPSPPPPPPAPAILSQAWDSNDLGSGSFLAILPFGLWFTTPSSSHPTPSPTEISDDELDPMAISTPSLLSCYLYLVAIFSIFFRHLRTLLSQHPVSSLTALQLVPQLRLAGRELDYGALQVRVLMQVVEHHFVSIEAALGLPDEHRIFPRQGGGREGLRLADVMGDGVAVSTARIIASLRQEMALVRRLVEEGKG